MRILLIAATGLALMIALMYLSIVKLSSCMAKYDYCYDTEMAAKYNLRKPDFTEYSLKSEQECNTRITASTVEVPNAKVHKHFTVKIVKDIQNDQKI